MAEPMPTFVEVWPVAADWAGIWLISEADAWRSSLPVMSDSEPHWEVELELAQHKVKDHVKALHSTSWRVDGQRIILTYVAVLDADGNVRERWPGATPVSRDLAKMVGPAPAFPATEAPAPRYVDVLLHAIRHLRFLRDFDATVSEALPAPWAQLLGEWEPELARMFSVPYRDESP